MTRDPAKSNAFFRWKTIRDTPDTIEMTVLFDHPLRTRHQVHDLAASNSRREPAATAKVQVKPKTIVHWTYGSKTGTAQADATACITIPRLQISAAPVALTIRNP